MTDEQREQLRIMLRDHEGVRTVPYRDTNNHLTVGVGHNLEVGKLPPDISSFLATNHFIRQDMIDRILDIDIGVAEKSCGYLYPDFKSYPWEIQMALIDWVFNLGAGKIARDFNPTNAHIKEKEWGEVIKHFKQSLWAKQVGRRAVDLINLIKKGANL